LINNEEKMLEFEKGLEIKEYILKEFKFQSGEILKDLKVEYTTIGTPIKNEKDEIINGIVFCHGLGGSSSSIRRLHEIIAPNRALDIDKYFIISITTLGSPGSHCPSNSGLGNKFPDYTIEDMVNFQKEFLGAKFNINHLKVLIGNSMGGFEVLKWGTLHPTYMDKIISLVSSYKVAGHNYALFKFINHIVENDPEYNDGNYSKPLKSIGIANESVYPFGLSLEFYRNLSIEEIDQGLEELGADVEGYDGNDVVKRNNASCQYDIENEINKIVAKTLIVAINQDQYFPPKLDAIPMSKMIKNSKLVIYDSLLGHLGVSEIAKIENELKEFLQD